ncbi:MAG: acyl-CoA dehydrogenase family protein [Alphaproteobacteria bacterium]|nr:acyl-CoA dehydrogenase family protein [Alphaproteobacteria bacterium]MBU0795656.1 acyl-CoA dehydrogenase family protein [Alphaproteobacteria bacterium]MBU0887279.1 acyl-CoA dehydrogenase family protein [Alphaproteobacteria bacterium]MBU1811840.1 acyl-CoA dehydrogenase family protein [Alphaproteobacteria bacterium]MBU2088959.1 acyl-CoA dehydrogenase family protein [Alphaproteobacteria bacterium]
MTRLTDAQLSLQARARELAQTVIAPRAAEVDRSEQYPWHNVKAMVEAGFFGMTIPQQYGGQGLGYLETCLVIEEMAKVCGVTGRIAVEANMGAVGAIMAYGSEEQKKLAAALVLKGDKPAICITEPDAGSAATEMTTRADKKGDRYILNGKKHWITGGGVSKLHLIFARIFDDGVEQGIGGFIAVRDPEAGIEPKGLIIGKREPTMGLRGIPEAEVIFEDLEISADMLVTPPEGIRRGFAGLMNAYNGQRVGAATVAFGIAEGAYETALAFTKKREQFGRPIYEFQGLQFMLADMSIAVEAARAMIHNAAVSGERFPDPTAAAQAKVFASEMAVKVTNDALQLHGAAGYSRNNPVERMVRDARMFTIGGGTAQVLRTLIASRILGAKLPQTRDGYLNLPRAAAE